MKKFRFTVWDAVVLGVLIALAWAASARTMLLAVIAYLLYLLLRSQLSRPAATPIISVDDNEFFVDDDGLSHATVDLDIDIDYQSRKNHFRLDSRFDTVSRDAEYEYKIDGTKVSVRLLHASLEDVGLPKVWEVRDGVLLEAELRERLKTNTTFSGQEAREEEIADRKRALEWHEMLPTYFNGLEYFILWKNLPRDEGRRYLRQETERLKLGSNRFMEEAAKIGFIHDETSRWRLRLPDGVDPSQDERQKLSDSISSFGIPYDEFVMAPGLIAAIEKYVACLNFEFERLRFEQTLQGPEENCDADANQ
jgi:hypothetical protein